MHFAGTRWKHGNAKEDCRSMTSSTTSRISTKSIEEIVEKLCLDRFRDSTRRTYYTVWKIFSKFFIRLDVKPKSWEKRLVLFTGYLVDNKKQSSTIKSYLSAITAILEDEKIHLDEDKSLLSSLTRACRLKNDAFVRKLPISKGVL